MSGIVNKVKEKLGQETAKNDTQHGSTNAGEHNSNAANKLDPRIDSDQDGRANPGSMVGGYGGTAGSTISRKQGETAGPYAGSVIGTAGSGAAPNTAGPHDKDILNKADPRVDSDKDNSMKLGSYKTNA